MKLEDNILNHLKANKHLWEHSKITHDATIHPLTKYVIKKYNLKYHPTEVNRPVKAFLRSVMTPTKCQICTLSYSDQFTLLCNVIDRPHTTIVTYRDYQCPCYEPYCITR